MLAIAEALITLGLEPAVNESRAALGVDPAGSWPAIFATTTCSPPSPVFGAGIAPHGPSRRSTRSPRPSRLCWTTAYRGAARAVAAASREERGAPALARALVRQTASDGGRRAAVTRGARSSRQ